MGQAQRTIGEAWGLEERKVRKPDITNYCLIFNLLLFGCLKAHKDDSKVNQTIFNLGGNGNAAFLSNTGSSVFNSKESIKEACTRMRSAGVTEVYTVVWNKNKTLATSIKVTINGIDIPLQTFKNYVGPNNRPRDTFREVLESCSDMNVYAWFEYGTLVTPGEIELGEFLKRVELEKSRIKPSRDNLMVSDQFAMTALLSGWLLTNKNGQKFTTKPSRGKFLFGHMDPMNQQVLDFLTSYFQSLTARYSQYKNFKGILLDDNMGLPPDFGYSANMIQRFQNPLIRTANSRFDPIRDFTDGGLINQLNPFNSTFPNFNPNSMSKNESYAWQKFRIGIVSRMFENIRRSLDRKFKILLSPVGLLENSQAFSLDWEFLRSHRTVDRVIMQAYYDDLCNHVDFLRELELSNNQPDSIAILSSLAIPLLQQVVMLTNQINYPIALFTWGKIQPANAKMRENEKRLSKRLGRNIDDQWRACNEIKTQPESK